MTGEGFGGANPFGAGPNPHRPSAQQPGLPRQQQTPPWGGQSSVPRPPAGDQPFGRPPAQPQWSHAGGPQPDPFGNPPTHGPPAMNPTPAGGPGPKKWLKLPSSKRGRGVLLGAGAVAVVAALVSAGVMIVGGGAGDEQRAPSEAADVVVAYLEALQRGDAKAVLSLGRETPPDTSLLTDEILKKQFEKFPITDVRVLGAIPFGTGGASVHVVAKIGGVENDTHFGLEKPQPGQDWKLKNTSGPVELPESQRASPLAKYITVAGKPFPSSGKLYAFPGKLDVGSANSALKVVDTTQYLRASPDPTLADIAYPSMTISPSLDLSDKGADIVKQALQKAIDACVSSTSLEPPNCPNKVARSDLVPDSATWTAPPNLDALTVKFIDTKTGKISIIGSPTFGVSVKTTSGETVTGTADPLIYGNADLTTDLPTIDLNNP